MSYNTRATCIIHQVVRKCGNQGAFLLTHTHTLSSHSLSLPPISPWQRDARLPHESLEYQIGRIVGQVAPSILLTGISESVAFFLGAVIDVPAVKIFSLYAAMAVLIDFLLQVCQSLMSTGTIPVKSHQDCIIKK